MRRFTSPEHNMIRNLDRKIQLAKQTDEKLKHALQSSRKKDELEASLELARREEAAATQR